MTQGDGNGRADAARGEDGSALPVAVPRVVRAAGDLDLHTGPALRSELLSRITGGERDLVVDMSKVSYLDSSGITVLIGALKAARTTGGTVRLAQCQPVILQLLDLTGLSRVFPVYPTVQEAQSDPVVR